MASLYLEQGRAIPLPQADAAGPGADLVELLLLSLEATQAQRRALTP
jgi:hypothetical protein